MAPGHPHRHHHGPLRRVGAIIGLLALVALAMPLRAQDGLYRAKSPIEIDRTSQYPRLIWQMNLDSLEKIIREIGLVDSSCYKAFSVPLGHYGQIMVEREELTVSRQCDTSWTYPLPAPGDTSYIVASNVALYHMQLNMFAQTGRYRDTVRLAPNVGATISFVRDPVTGVYVGNLKEYNPTYPWRIGTSGDFFGKDWMEAPTLGRVAFGPGGLWASRDTVVVTLSAAIILAVSSTDTTYVKRVQHTKLDTIRQTVADPGRYRGDPLLGFRLINCGDRPDVARWLAPEKIWIPAGRDSLVYIDTCRIECPRFIVDGVTTRSDTVCRIDTLYTDDPIIVTDTGTVYGCVNNYWLPTSFIVTLQSSVSTYVMRESLDSLKAIHGELTFPGRALRDSIEFRFYDMTNTLVGVQKRAEGVPAYPCDTANQVTTYPPGWDYDGRQPWYRAYTGGVQSGWVDTYSKTVYIPVSALDSLAGGAPCGESVRIQPDPTTLMFTTGSCCTHDTTVAFDLPSILDPTKRITGTYTWQVPDDSICDYHWSRDIVIGFEIDTIITTCEINTYNLDTPAYSIAVKDSCECDPADAVIELVNASVTWCNGVRLVSECGVRQPYLGADGRTIVIPCEDHQIWINGRRSNSFTDIATTIDLRLITEWMRYVADSLGAQCPPCVDSLLTRVSDIESRLDSLEGRVTDLEAKQPICGTAAFDPSGEYVIMGLGDAPKNVTITYTQGGGTTVPYSEWAGGNLILRGTPELPITYCYWP